MANVTFKLNRAGVRELLMSEEMMDICEGYANKALAKLGPGYEVSTYAGKNRVNASVKAVSNRAKRDNYNSNTILKAVMG